MNAFLVEGILPNKEYFGIVEFYDPNFTPGEGRGRIKGYIGKETGRPDPFRLFEVFEKGIKHALSFSNDRNLLLENEIVRFKVTISSVGFTAEDIAVLMKVSPAVVKIDDLLERMHRNYTYYEGTCCPTGPPILGLGARIRTYEKPDLVDGEKEVLPKIIKLSREGVESEQKT